MSAESASLNDAVVGRALRELRLSQHIKQSELARALNVTRATITRWENGTRPMTVSTLLMLAELLGAPASLLLPEHHQTVSAPDDFKTPVAHEVLPSGHPAIRAIEHVLEVRPDLIPTVVALLETLVAEDDDMRAPTMIDSLRSAEVWSQLPGAKTAELVPGATNSLSRQARSDEGVKYKDIGLE
jgi:transcriptional regulator with XRE-family HTH domain